MAEYYELLPKKEGPICCCCCAKLCRPSGLFCMASSGISSMKRSENSVKSWAEVGLNEMVYTWTLLGKKVPFWGDI